MSGMPAKELLHFIKNSPTCYHVTENIRQKLLSEGYHELSEREKWNVKPGGKYFVCRNGRSTPTAAARTMSSSPPKNTAGC